MDFVRSNFLQNPYFSSLKLVEFERAWSPNDQEYQYASLHGISNETLYLCHKINLEFSNFKQLSCTVQ